MQHTYFLLEALEQAKIRRGFCSPNPSVGALIVKDNRIISRGYHFRCGDSHAEAAAISLSPEDVSGATLYVTLEPCCHVGKTPPCTKLIIEKGFKAVVFGYKDPDPRMQGKGQHTLESAGIACLYHPLPEITEFYTSYEHWHKTQLPWVTAKLALSLNGKISGKDGKPEPITGTDCQMLTHQHRKKSDAILTTATTILCDDPKLNVRLGSEVIPKPIYVLDSRLRIPVTARLLQSTSCITVFHGQDVDSKRRELLASLGIKCIEVPWEERGLSLQNVLAAIGRAGVHDLWVEAGGKCFEALLQEGLMHRALIYKGRHFVTNEAKIPFSSTLSELSAAKRVKWELVGKDIVWDFALI